MRIRHILVLVQPVIPVPHRLTAKVPRARSLFLALFRGFSLLVVFDAGEHRRQHNQTIGLSGKLEIVDAEWLIGQLLRFTARSRQKPDLHSLYLKREAKVMSVVND